jgi:hypothetical protein
MSTRTGEDGFFVRSPGITPGSRVRYQCLVNGTEVSDVVPLDGAMETFVYTGSAPTAIRILEIIPGMPPVPPRAPPPVPVRTTTTNRGSSPEPISAPFLDPILSDLAPPIIPPSSPELTPSPSPSSSSSSSSSDPFLGHPRAY